MFRENAGGRGCVKFKTGNRLARANSKFSMNSMKYVTGKGKIDYYHYLVHNIFRHNLVLCDYNSA